MDKKEKTINSSKTCFNFFYDLGAPLLEGALGTCLHCLLGNPALQIVTI